MSQIILASSSTYRKQLPFDTISPDVDETPQSHESPQQLCERLSRAKAQAVSILNPAKIVIGSDQVASLNGMSLGKPGNKLCAIQQLQSCSATSVDFFTGLCLQRGDIHLFHLAHTQVKFRDLSTLEINTYLEAETPWDCAGSFKAEGLGICLFESINSQDPTDLIGLPLIALSRMLREFSVNPLTPT
jgi:septum formation protein